MCCLVIDVFVQDRAEGLSSFFWELKPCLAELSFFQATNCIASFHYSFPKHWTERDFSQHLSGTVYLGLTWKEMKLSCICMAWRKLLLGIVHGLCSDLLWFENITDLFLKYVLLLFCVSQPSQDLSKISFTYWTLVRLSWLTMQHQTSRDWPIFFSCESLF